MTSLPTGTVTFLFSDIEGSTKLAREHPDQWESLRQRHNVLLRAAMDVHEGYVFQIIGDAFCVAFHTASAAIRAALKSQIDLGAENWGETSIKVRMGIHTGKAEIQENGEYQGYLAMSRVQRLTSAAHGGQVLISVTTQDLVREDVPEGISLCDMGERRLKDLIHPEHIYQLVSPDLPVDFPPIRTLDAYRHNLPTQMTNFIGREKEITKIKQAVSGHRLVTLTGSGGTGKTRLSLQVGADALDQFPNGVWFVELAAISDPDLIPQTILSVFKIGDQPGLTSLQVLVNYLQGKNLLLILDNCEHLVESTANLTMTLLAQTKELKILVTSREALGVDGELSWSVPSLTMPDYKEIPIIETLSQYEAVRLFIDRATLKKPNFMITKENAQAIAQICFQLDGIPLAIEMACALVRVLSVDQICGRLDERFRLLTGGNRTALPRQQTLRATLDWSYNLLSEQETILFKRLAVFSGGWTLEAVEQICMLVARELDVLGILSALVDKSLVLMDEASGEVRYHFLETTRLYAREKLFESGEGETLRDHHLDWFSKYAEQGDTELQGFNQILWMSKLEAEIENLRLALEWSLSANHIEKGLHLANLMADFWWKRGYIREGIYWLEKTIEQCGQLKGMPVRAKGLFQLGQFLWFIERDWLEVLPLYEESLKDYKNLGDAYRFDYVYVLADFGYRSYDHGDHETSKAYLQEGLQILHETEYKREFGWILLYFAEIEQSKMDLETALQKYEEGITLFRENGDSFKIALALLRKGEIKCEQGNYPESQGYCEESLDIFREFGCKTFIFQCLNLLGILSRISGNYEKALICIEESLSIYNEFGGKPYPWYFRNLGYILLELHDDRKALHYFNEALKLGLESQKKGSLILILAGYAAVAVVRGKGRAASRLYGAMDSQIQKWVEEGNNIKELTDSILPQDIDRYKELCRTQLGEASFEAALSEGKAMALDEAIDLAIKCVEGEG